MQTDCLPRFILQFLLSPVGRDLIVKKASSTTGLHTLSISKVSSLPVPVTTQTEQAVLLQLLDEKLSTGDFLVQEINSQLIRATALRQAILKKAFSGQLVKQDPNDEPASALLAKIKAEKASLANKKSRNGKEAA